MVPAAGGCRDDADQEGIAYDRCAHALFVFAIGLALGGEVGRVFVEALG